MRRTTSTLLLALLYFIAYSQDTIPPAPDFRVTTTKGDQITLYGDYLDKGKTVLIELFWEACPPCNAFAPYLGDLYKEWGNGTGDVEFIAITVLDEDDALVKAFQDRYGHTWPGISITGGALEARLPYTDMNNPYGRYLGTPTMVIIAPDGTVSYDVNGFKRDAAGIDLLDDAIAATGAIKPLTATTTTITGGIETIKREGVGNVTLHFSGGTETSVITGMDGTFTLPDLPIDEAYTIRPEKTGAIDNGLTTFDLVLLSKHILGTERFTHEAQLIAADANLSGTVSSFDIVLFRKIILGVDSTLAAGSWRFLPEKMELTSLNDIGDLAFTGVKIGDLNNSGDPNNLLQSDSRSAEESFSLRVTDRVVKAGEIVDVAFSADEVHPLLGFQFTLDFDVNRLQLVGVKEASLNNFSKNNMNLQQKENGKVTMSWFDLETAATVNLFTLQFKATKEGQLSELLSINSSITKAEAYTNTTEIADLELQFTAAKTVTSNPTTIFPNPTLGSATLHIDLQAQQTIQIELVGIDGTIIQQSPYQAAEEGAQVISLSMNDLQAGLYFVKITNTTGELIDFLKIARK